MKFRAGINKMELEKRKRSTILTNSQLDEEKLK
jgi:hypothetical protein